MHTDPNQNRTGPEHVQNPEVAFEKRDLGARGILLFFAILFIAGATIHLVVWGLYKAFVNVGEEYQPPANPMVPRQSAPAPGVLQNAGSINLKQFPEPRLQTDEPTDVNRFLWQEGQLLDAKPWRDQTGAIHIPIAEAMQIVAQKGLPTRQGARQAFAPQPPMGQTESGNIAMSESEKAGDAVSVPGAPVGFDTLPSDREKEAPLPGVQPEKPHSVTGSAPGLPLYVPQQKPKK